MKQILLFIFITSVAIANNTFEKEIAYTCLNTHSIQQGQQINTNPNHAKNNPFDFTIKDDKLISTDKVVFDFKMKKGPMASYSNAAYMLLLTPNLQVGLVPKKAKGAVQYYFSCRKK